MPPAFSWPMLAPFGFRRRFTWSLGQSKNQASMSLAAFGTKAFTRAVSWAAPALLRKKYPKTVLADLVDFDVIPRHEALNIDLCSAANFRLAVVVANRSPFVIELDRARVSVHCAGYELECFILERTLIPAAKKHEFFLRGHISNEIADAIHGNLASHQTGISASIEFNCSVHNFQKRTQHLGGVRAVFSNTEWRQKFASISKLA